MIFSGDNGDLKFPHRLPILPETHEVLLYDVRRCVGKVSELDMAYEVQIGQAVTAGYFGGYTAKMQDIGQKESRSLQLSIERKADLSKDEPEQKAYRVYAQRLVKGSGMQRYYSHSCRMCESCFFCRHHPDNLKAECVRSFPSVHFPANLWLRREEIETHNKEGFS